MVGIEYPKSQRRQQQSTLRPISDDLQAYRITFSGDIPWKAAFEEHARGKKILRRVSLEKSLVSGKKSVVLTSSHIS